MYVCMYNSVSVSVYLCVCVCVCVCVFSHTAVLDELFI